MCKWQQQKQKVRITIKIKIFYKKIYKVIKVVENFIKILNYPRSY